MPPFSRENFKLGHYRDAAAWPVATQSAAQKGIRFRAGNTRYNQAKMMRYDAFREEYNGYDTAQLCLNGHLVTEYARSQPEHNQKFCGKCGAETITSCPSCNHFIRGFYHILGDVSIQNYSAPAFCYNCGKPYPWTETGIKAAKGLISESEKLSPEEKETLSRSLDDIVRDTPNTQLAVIHFKKFLPKTGKEIADAVRSIVVDIASEAAKKLLWPS